MISRPAALDLEPASSIASRQKAPRPDTLHLALSSKKVLLKYRNSDSELLS